MIGGSPDGQQRINSAKATYNSIAGLIESEWNNVSGKYVYSFTIPEGTTATVKLISNGNLNVNGIDFTVEALGGKKCEACNRVVFELGAGKYTIKS
jgi:alpha-L-rhamnosidase